MSKNSGKIFEDDFRKSVPDYCFLHRLKDAAQSYNKSENTKFAWENPCDFFIFDSNTHILYALELKSTKYKSMTIQADKTDKSKMIKLHQIESLTNMSKYDGVMAGFVFNFRDEKNNMERTYFQNIIDFNNMYEKINKQSLNEMDLLLNGAVKINGTKKRVHYTWDLNEFLSA